MSEDMSREGVDDAPPPPPEDFVQPLPAVKVPSVDGAVIYAAPVEGLSEDHPQRAASQITNLGDAKGPSANLLRLVLRVAGFNRRKLLLKVIEGEEFTWTSRTVHRAWNKAKEDWDEHTTERTTTETPSITVRLQAWDLLMKHGLGGSATADGGVHLPTIIKEVAGR